jgi:hypothetical protein
MFLSLFYKEQDLTAIYIDPLRKCKHPNYIFIENKDYKENLLYVVTEHGAYPYNAINSLQALRQNLIVI